VVQGLTVLRIWLCQESTEDEYEEEVAGVNAIDDNELAEPEPSLIQGTDALMTVIDMKDSSVAAAGVDVQARENDD